MFAEQDGPTERKTSRFLNRSLLITCDTVDSLKQDQDRLSEFLYENKSKETGDLSTLWLEHSV